MKHIVSVSLGSSRRDKRSEVVIAGEPFLIERIGTDGDLRRFQQMFATLDGAVDALGIGGADLYIWVGNRRYTFRSIQRLVSVARQTLWWTAAVSKTRWSARRCAGCRSVRL